MSKRLESRIYYQASEQLQSLASYQESEQLESSILSSKRANQLESIIEKAAHDILVLLVIIDTAGGPANDPVFFIFAVY